MNEPFVFLDTLVSPGDIIALEPIGEAAQLIPEQVEVAVLDIDTDGYLLTLVPHMLAHLANPLRIMSLNPRDVRSIKLVSSAENAIPERSGPQQFQFHERVSMLAGGTRYEGNVIAAIENIVAVCVDTGNICVGGDNHFERVQASATA